MLNQSLDDTRIHLQAVQLLIDVFQETATPEQRDLYREKLGKLVDDNFAERDIRNVIDFYWFSLASNSPRK